MNGKKAKRLKRQAKSFYERYRKPKFYHANITLINIIPIFIEWLRYRKLIKLRKNISFKYCYKTHKRRCT